MKNINSEKIFSGFKKILIRFPLTILFSMILTGYQLNDQSFFFLETDILYITFTFGFLFSILAQFVYEVFFEGKKNFRWLIYGVSLLLTALYYFFLSSSLHLVDNSWQLYTIPGIRSMIVYFITLISLIWLPTLKNKYNFSESFLIIFRAFFITSFFSLVLFLGVTAILSLFELLFFTLDADWWTNTSIIITNLFGPLLFLNFLPEGLNNKEAEKDKKESSVKLSKFMYNLITYIFIPVNIVLTGIIVLYILTNLTNDFFTASALEALILSYTISGWILLTLTASIEHILAKWFKRIFPFSLIFVLVLQMMATFLQIQKVGITHGRYLIILFGVSSVISAIWYLAKNHDLSLVPIVALIASLIALTPPIDAIGLSVRQQTNRINQILVENKVLDDSQAINKDAGENVSKEDQQKVMESISYLHEIDALNQLAWLPKDYYDRTNVYLNFTVTESSIQIPDQSEGTNVFLETENINVNVADYDYFYNLFIDDESKSYQDDVTINDQKYKLEVIFEDKFLIKFISQEDEEDLLYDFSYILEDFKEQTQVDYTVDELTFTAEDQDLTIQILIKYLYIQEDYQEIQFYLFY